MAYPGAESTSKMGEGCTRSRTQSDVDAYCDHYWSTFLMGGGGGFKQWAYIGSTLHLKNNSENVKFDCRLDVPLCTILLSLHFPVKRCHTSNQ